MVQTEGAAHKQFLLKHAKTPYPAIKRPVIGLGVNKVDELKSKRGREWNKKRDRHAQEEAEGRGKKMSRRRGTGLRVKGVCGSAVAAAAMSWLR